MRAATSRSTISHEPSWLVLAQHLAVAKVLILVNHHAISLRRDVEDRIRLLAIFVHGSFVIGEGRLAVLVVVIRIEELPETLDAYTTKDTENIALVFVEF